MMSTNNTMPIRIESTEKSAEYPAALPAALRAEYAKLKDQNSPTLLARCRERLLEAATSPVPDVSKLLSAFAILPNLNFLLQQDSRIPERYSIAEHESMFIGQYNTYSAAASKALPLQAFEFQIFGLLHDIGKPLPDSKADQHRSTLQVIRDVREALPLSDESLRIICSLIGNDPLGRFVVKNFERQASIEQRKEIAELARQRPLEIKELQTFSDLVRLKAPDAINHEEAIAIAKELKLRAAALGISADSLYRMHLLSYLSDVGAYTYGAVAYNGRRASPGIEFVFALNPHFCIGKDEALLLAGPDGPRPSEAVGKLFDLIKNALNA